MQPNTNFKTILLCCFFWIKLAGQTTPIFHHNWQEALQEAQATNKPIFVDFHTSWCGPCRWMEKHVFPNPVVSDFFERRFVLFKTDAEKGIGIQLAEIYEPASFPTYLCLTPAGDELYRFSGQKNVKEFLLELEFGIRPERIAKPYQKRLANVPLKENPMDLSLSSNKNLSKEQLREKIEELSLNNLPNNAFFNQYFDLLSNQELKEQETLIFLIDFLPNFNSKAGLFLFQNQRVISYRNQRSIQAALSSFYDDVVELKDESLLDTYIKYEQAFLQPSPYFPSEFRAERAKIKFFEDTKQPFRFEKALISYVENKLLKTNFQFIDEKFKAENIREGIAGEVVSQRQSMLRKMMIDEVNAELSFYANKLLGTNPDKEVLSKALFWSLESHKHQPNSIYFFTTAKVYLALDKKTEARSFAKQALELSKKNNENTMLIEDFLKRF